MSTEEQEQEPQKYFIDLLWYDRHDRSFRVVAEKRFCPSCQSKIGTEVQERLPTIDPKTGKVVYEMRAVPFGSNPTAVIRSCCSKERGFITAEMPILEAVFRVFLMNGNQPTDLGRVREDLAQWFPLTSRAHNYSTDLLRRLIEADHQYGLREFKPQAIE
ncbi:MAG: hypothetical protein M1401_02110 [Chloroflexi bacterium]|nr:hypothetical protein [Chloroflexota bacterium]MCL5107673.1 hypothetical protein [Chloroflexota bacterium]